MGRVSWEGRPGIQKARATPLLAAGGGMGVLSGKEAEEREQGVAAGPRQP